MSWVTAIWAILIGTCAAMALPNLFVGIWQRRAADLFFVGVALGTIGLAAGELGMMYATSSAQYGEALRWVQVPIFLIVISIVGFVHFYLGTGRLWLGLTTCAVRFACVIINFASPVNLTFREITGLNHVQFFGEPVAIGTGVVSPWVHLAELSSLLMAAFVADASISLWRKGKPGDRRRAVTVGGSIVFFVLVAQTVVVLFRLKITPAPYSTCLWFFAIVAAMALELGYDLFAAAQIAQKLQLSDAALRESEARINLAANAANLGLWLWNIPGDELWVTEKWRELFGFADSEPVTFARLLQIVHPGDHERMKQLVQQMFEHGGEYESEYRITRPDGKTRWILGHGSVELDEHGKPAFARGVSRDVTKRKIAEEKLRESEARFRTVADAAPVLIWMSGLDKLCTFFNKPWLEFTGRTMEQEMGNGWTEGVHPDDLQRCMKIYVQAFDACEPFVMQYRLRRHDGEYRWISDTGVPRYDVQENFAGYIGSCVDVTELLRKEQALRESEERMSLALDAANLGLWEWNVAKDELWGTKARRALLGLSVSGKIKLEDALSTVHVDDRDRVRQALKDAARTGKNYHFEYRVVLPDGSERWTDHRGRCVKGEDGKDLVLRGVSMDVTEQKQSRELFRMATEASPSGIVLIDNQGRIVLVNSHVEELFGYNRKELLGKRIEILVPERFASQHPEHRARFLAAPTARAMGAGRELFGRRKDGSEFPVEIGLSPIQTPEGMLVLAAVVDISARKLAEAEAIQRREEVGHLSRVAVMGELAASIAHELNQPLAGIISNASAGQRFIDRGNVDLHELRELLADVIADGRRAGEVIRGIRNMVKKGSQVREPVSLNDLVTNVVRMVTSDAMLRSCDLDTLLEPDLPSIEGDPIQLQQVLLNLLVNAFDAMRDTPLSRRKVLIVTERNGNNAIRTSVRDYGTGIPAEARDRLFDHFFTTKAQGLGMGLAIVRSIVESHSGTIAGENAEGGGARFHFTLPLSRQRAAHSGM
jgi:PAS domain S-box-containing protein